MEGTSGSELMGSLFGYYLNNETGWRGDLGVKLFSEWMINEKFCWLTQVRVRSWSRGERRNFPLKKVSAFATVSGHFYL